MLRILLSLSLLCAVPTLACAKVFKIGDDGPVASIMIPDSWGPSEIDDGVEATSTDKETYVAAEIVKGSSEAIDEAVKEEDKFFVKQKIKIKPDSKKEKETTVNGLKAFDYSWDATDEDGPTHVSVTFVVVGEGKLLLLTYWGSAAGETSNGADLKAIGQSITPIK